MGLKEVGVSREGIARIEVRGSRIGGSVKVCICVYKLPVNCTKT
jgi:hypothetical protein